MAALDFWWLLKEASMPQSVLMSTQYLRGVPLAFDQLVNTDGTWKYESVVEYLGINAKLPVLLDYTELIKLRSQWKVMAKILYNDSLSPWTLSVCTSAQKDTGYGQLLFSAGGVDYLNGAIGTYYEMNGELRNPWNFKTTTAVPTGTYFPLPNDLQGIFSGPVRIAAFQNDLQVYRENIKGIDSRLIDLKDGGAYSVLICMGRYEGYTAEGVTILRNDVNFRCSKSNEELASIFSSNPGIGGSVTGIEFVGATVRVTGIPSVFYSSYTDDRTGYLAYLAVPVASGSSVANGTHFIKGPQNDQTFPTRACFGDGTHWFNSVSSTTSVYMNPKMLDYDSHQITEWRGRWKVIDEMGWLDEPDNPSEHDARQTLNAIDLTCMQVYISGLRVGSENRFSPPMLWVGRDGRVYASAAGAVLVDQAVTESNLVFRYQVRKSDGTPVSVEVMSGFYGVCLFYENGRMMAGTLVGQIIVDTCPIASQYEYKTWLHDVAPGESVDIAHKWKYKPSLFFTGDPGSPSIYGCLYQTAHESVGTPVSATGRNALNQARKAWQLTDNWPLVECVANTSYPVSWKPKLRNGYFPWKSFCYSESAEVRLTAALVLSGGGSGATITATCWIQDTTEHVEPGYTKVPVVKARVSVHPFNSGQAFPWPADSFIKYRKWTKTGEQGSGTPSDPTIELGYYDHLIDKLDMTSDQTKDANVIDYPRTSPVVEYGAGYKWKLGTSSLQWTAGFDIPRTYISEYRSYNIISGAVAQVTTQEEDDEIVAQDPSESNPNLTGWQLHHKQYFDIVPRTLETFTYDQPLIGSTFVGIKDVISYPTNLATDSPRVSVPCLGGLIRPSDALIANLTTYKDSVVYPGKGQHGGLEPHYPVWNPVSLNGATPAAVIFIGESLTLYHAGGEITSARNFNETTGKIEKGGPTGYKYTGTKPGYDLILIVDDYNKLPVTVPVIVIGASMLYAWTPAPWGGTYKDELVTGKNDLDSLPPFVLTLDRIAHPSLNAITASNYTTETLTPTKFREFTNYFYTRDILCPDGSNPPRQTSNNFQDPGAPTAYKGDVGWAYASGNYTGQSSGLPPVNVLRHAEYQIDPDNYANNKYVTKRDIRLVTCSASLEVSTSSQKLTVLLSESYPVKILIYLRKWRELETNNYTTSSYKPTRFGAFCPLASEAVVKTSDTSYVLDLSSTTYDIPVGHDQGLLVQVRGVDLGESFTIVLPNAIVRTVMGMDIGGGSASLPSGVDNVPPATDGPVLKP